MLWVVVTGIIAVLCLLALIRKFREGNLLAILFSFVGFIVFGGFTLMTTLEYFGLVGPGA